MYEPSVSADTDAETVVPKLAAAITDVGLVRQHNEDSHGMIESLGLYVVCDGMGGAAGGAVASQMAVEEFLGYARTHAPAIHLRDRDARLNLLQGAILHANQTVFERSLADSGLHGMGSTLVCAWFVEREVILGNIGDSRAYLVRGNTIKQLTEDHSLLAEQVRQGTMTENEAALSPMQSVITRALGTRNQIEPDFFLLEAEPGDRVLLTSDGMFRHVPDDLILATTRKGKPLEVCAKLVELALEGGGSDNTTCVLVQT